MAVPLIGPDGREYEINDGDAAGLQNVLAKGFRVATAEAPRTFGESAQAFGNEAYDTVEAGGIGLLKGLTGGLSDVARGAVKRQDELPEEKANRLASLESQQKNLEAHPVAHGSGELAGMLVSPINKVGAAVRGGIGATTAIGRIGAGALAAGAEGALYGAGNTLSDAALGDYDLTAEKMLAGVGLGGVLGLAGGGIGTGLAEGFKAIAPKVSGLVSGAKGKLEDFAEDRWLKAGGGIQSDIKKIPEGERAAVANVIREAMSPVGKVLPDSLDEAAAVVTKERDAVAKQLLKQVGVDDAGGLHSKMNQEEALEALGKSIDANGARVGEVLKKADAMGATPSYSSALARFDTFEQGLNLAEKDLVQKELGQVRKYLTEMGSDPALTGGQHADIDFSKFDIKQDGMRNLGAFRKAYDDAAAKGVSATDFASAGKFGSSGEALPIKIVVEDGKQLLSEGRHRLAMAQEKGAKSILARVVRHGPGGEVLSDTTQVLPIGKGAAAVANPKNSFSALNSIKSTIQKDTNFVADGSAKFGLKRQIAGILRDEIDTQLAPQIGSDLSKEFLQAKQAFGALSQAEKALGKKTSTGADAIRALVEGASLAEPSLAGKLSAMDHAANLIKHGQDRALGNRSISGSDYLAGLGAGVMTGGPLGALSGLASAIGHKLVRERGSAVIAKLADTIAASPRMQVAATSFGNQLQAVAPQMGKYAPALTQALAQSPAHALATHMTMAKADPGYAAAAAAAGFLPETPEEAAHAGAKGDHLAAIAFTLDKQNTEIEKSIGAVFKGEKPPKESKVLNSQDFGTKRMRRDSADAHTKRVDEIRALAADPNALLERLTGNAGQLSEMAPGVVASMTRTTHAAVAYLAKESEEPPKAGPLAHAWVPNEAERHSFAQKLEAVEQPMSVLRHAAAGTLVPAQWEAVQAVYPMLARQISDMALQRMADPPKDVPYRSRLMLSIITGVDPDGTLGQGIALNQVAIAATASEPSNEAAAGAKPDIKLTLGTRTATPGQKREQQEMANG